MLERHQSLVRCARFRTKMRGKMEGGSVEAGGEREGGRADTYITGFPDSDELISVTRRGRRREGKPATLPRNTIE